jgi:hypothetical protein
MPYYVPNCYFVNSLTIWAGISCWIPNSLSSRNSSTTSSAICELGGNLSQQQGNDVVLVRANIPKASAHLGANLDPLPLGRSADQEQGTVLLT